MQETPEMSNQPTRAYLKQLLSERNQYAERAAEIDEEIRRVFERKAAVLAMDMCGFSNLSAQFGIVHFLAMIHQMEQAATPAVTGNGGQVIKQEADNLFAIFNHPVHALEAALDIFRAFEAMNAVLPNERDIYGSIGIGFGDTLVIGNEDIFGVETNLASKLGEDLAGRMQILLSAAAYDALPPGRYACTPQKYTINGLEHECYTFDKCLFSR